MKPAIWIMCVWSSHRCDLEFGARFTEQIPRMWNKNLFACWLFETGWCKNELKETQSQWFQFGQMWFDYVIRFWGLIIQSESHVLWASFPVWATQQSHTNLFVCFSFFIGIHFFTGTSAFPKQTTFLALNYQTHSFSVSYFPSKSSIGSIVHWCFVVGDSFFFLGGFSWAYYNKYVYIYTHTQYI